MRVAILAAFPAHVIPGLEAHRPAGHYATWLPQLAEAFESAQGFDFHWIITSRVHIADEPIRWRGQTFHFLQNPARWRRLTAFHSDVKLIRERLDEIQPDLVHAWGMEDCYGMAGAHSGRPWLLSIQGLMQEYRRRTAVGFYGQLSALFEWYIFHRAHEMTAESLWARDMAQRDAPHSKIHLVEYGVPPLFYGQKWSPDPETPHAIFVGTPAARKGIQDVIAAFADPRLEGMQLHVLGETGGEFAAGLQRKATPNVRWIGRVDPEETARAMAKAWCMVMPTRADTGPTAVKEARVVGLPVITTRHAGARDYITDGVNGYHVEPGDIPALADRLQRVLGDLALAKKLGEARHAEQRDYFRPERTAESFLALYRQLSAPEDRMA